MDYLLLWKVRLLRGWLSLRDRACLQLARFALTHMGNETAWRWFTEMGRAYKARPDLAGEN